MRKLLIITATAVSGVFFRDGRKWTRDGVLIDPDTYDGDLDRLMAEPHLNVRPATEDEIARLSPEPAGLTDEDLIEVLVGEIAALDAARFGKDGKPRMPELRKVSAIDADLLTTDLRDAAFDRLVQGGFKPPVEGAV